MQRDFNRDIGSLEHLFRFVEEFFAGEEIDSALLPTVSLVLEELFTNMVKYNPDSRSDISISLQKENNRLTLRVVDFDVEPFDVTQTSPVAVDQPLEERAVGGLGLHLVKQMMDEVDYQYSNRESQITLIKELK